MSKLAVFFIAFLIVCGFTLPIITTVLNAVLTPLMQFAGTLASL